MAETKPEEVIAASLALRLVHPSDRQLRVDAVQLAIQANDKMRWGHKDKTSADYDIEMIATARCIHEFLTEQAPS